MTRHLRVALAVLALAAVVTLALPGEAAQAACYVQRFNFTLGQSNATTTMTADSGAPCNIKLNEGRSSIFKSLVPVTRPGRGSLRAQNSVNIAYQSRPGYQGADTFVFAIVGTRNGVAARSTVTVNVAVAGGVARPQEMSSVARSGTTRSSRQAPASALVTKCRQQAGAFIDPYTKRWIFTGTERESTSRTDMFRLCLAGGDREKAKTIAVQELHRSLGHR
jgi:hypothetical protein